MSYVLHVYRMTYKTYDMQEYIFVHPEEWYSMSPILRDLFVETLRLQPLGRTTAVFSMVLGFILAKTLCPQRHSKVCFELLETFWVTPKRTCLSVICSSVVGQLRWKEHIKKHKKFLIFLI